MRTIRQTTNRSQPRQHQTCLYRFSPWKTWPPYSASRFYCQTIFLLRPKSLPLQSRTRYVLQTTRVPILSVYDSTSDQGSLNSCASSHFSRWRIAIALVEIRIILLTAILVGLEHKFFIRVQTPNQL